MVVMNHKQKEFSFINKNGKEVKFLTRTFTFEIDEYLRERFGPDYSSKITSEKNYQIEISLEDAKKDFPILLNGFNEKEIDLAKQNYDDILKVYAFFLMYKNNAILRELEFNNETLALVIEQTKTILSLMPEISSQIKKQLTTTQGL